MLWLWPDTTSTCANAPQSLDHWSALMQQQWWDATMAACRSDMPIMRKVTSVKCVVTFGTLATLVRISRIKREILDKWMNEIPTSRLCLTWCWWDVTGAELHDTICVPVFSAAQARSHPPDTLSVVLAGLASQYVANSWCCNTYARIFY